MSEMVPMTATVLTAVKRRVSPDTGGMALGTLEPGTYTLQVGPEIAAGGYVWRYMVDSQGNAWYSATGPVATPQQWMTVTPVPVTPPTPPAPPESADPPEQPAAPDWELYLQQMQTVMRAWHDTLARMEQLLAALQAQMADLRNTLVETWPDVDDLE